MNKQLRTGDESTCQICGERIRWLVALWLHESLSPQPPHEAIPIAQEEKRVAPMNFIDWFHGLPKEKQDELLKRFHKAMMWRGQRGLLRDFSSVNNAIEKAAELCGENGCHIEEYT